MPHARRFLRHLGQILAEFRYAPGRNAVLFEDALHKHAEVEHARDGVVDLVRDARGELPQGSQAVVRLQLLLRALQLPAPFRHLAFERLSELQNLIPGRLQIHSHQLESVGQPLDFNAAVSRLNRPVEIHLADRLGPFH